MFTFNKSLRQFSTYCLIGVINTIVHFAVFCFANSIIGFQSISNLIGFFFGLCLSFVLNGKFTFKKKANFKSFIKFSISSGSLAFVFGWVGDVFVLQPHITFILYICINPLLGFLLAKYFAFK